MNRSSFSDIPPFFEPGVPAASFPLPIAQTEIGKMQAFGKLLAQEEIGPKSPNLHRKTRFSPYSPPTKAVVQQPSKVVTLPQRSGTPLAAPSNKATLEADSLSSLSSLTDLDDDPLILKPEGEAGRPGRGGYNLEETLSWKRKDFVRLKTYIKTLIDAHLDASKSFSSQSLASVNMVRNLALENFPVLRKYEGCWPAVDLVRLQLKYTSSRARLDQTKKDAVAGRCLRSRK